MRCLPPHVVSALKTGLISHQPNLHSVEQLQTDDQGNLMKNYHSNTSTNTAGHHVLGIKLHLFQFRNVLIPKSHPTRGKRRGHLGTSINSQVRSVTGVVPLPRNTADWLWRRIARLREVDVDCHDKQTDVFVYHVILGKTW